VGVIDERECPEDAFMKPPEDLWVPSEAFLIFPSKMQNHPHSAPTMSDSSRGVFSPFLSGRKMEGRPIEISACNGTGKDPERFKMLPE